MHDLVRVHGEVDLATVDDLRRVLADAGGPDPATGRAPDVLVCDLGGVTFLAAVGVGALAEFGDTARRSGTRFVIVAAHRPVSRLLEMCGLDRRYPVVSRLIDVPAQVRGQGPSEPPDSRGMR